MPKFLQKAKKEADHFTITPKNKRSVKSYPEESSLGLLNAENIIEGLRELQDTSVNITRLESKAKTKDS
ncbi:hypothetical protein CEXT_713351 [Caerostris extrusa]|uniref:Uncharacterized protein n=1 Tax=Caerostris extrusa TaxID=172846 RepID=A0AAV4TS60_CAEEX|nr:hypothetical protein CEXT_713351 [Caerostris extrusa]